MWALAGAIGIAGLLSWTTPSPAQEAAASAESITVYPVILAGRPNRDVAEVVALMLENAGLRQIEVPAQPFEKDPAGDYVYTLGPKTGVDTDPNLDANDELVFMAESIGCRCDDKPWPEGAKAGVRVELEHVNRSFDGPD